MHSIMKALESKPFLNKSRKMLYTYVFDEWATGVVPYKSTVYFITLQYFIHGKKK